MTSVAPTLTAEDAPDDNSIVDHLCESDLGVFAAAHALDDAVAALPKGAHLTDLAVLRDGFDAPVILMAFINTGVTWRIALGPDWRSNEQGFGPFPLTPAYWPVPATHNDPGVDTPITARKHMGTNLPAFTHAATVIRDQVINDPSTRRRRRDTAAQTLIDALSDAIRTISNAHDWTDQAEPRPLDVAL